MPLSRLVAETTAAVLDQYYANRIPPEFQDRIRVTWSRRGTTVTVAEERPGWRDPTEWTHLPIARFRFNAADGKWRLFCADRHERWHLYDRVRPTADLRKLLAEVDRDPTGIFWG